MSINIDYFDEDVKHCDEEFYKELLGDKYDKKNYHRFYYFENGEFVRTYDSVNSL